MSKSILTKIKNFQKRKTHLWRLIVWTLASTIMTIFCLYLLFDIFSKKNELQNSILLVNNIDDTIEDPNIWGVNFPLEFESYLKTVDQHKTKHGGSESFPQTPTSKDPRTKVSESKLVEDPRLKILWAGYPFSVDFREERGHAYMLEDQTFTGRQDAAPQPGACVNCHASTYVAMKKLGEGDLNVGFEKINQLPYAQARTHVQHPIACIDCHEPRTMKLRITRPAFMEGIKVYKEKLGVSNYDVNKQASHQEMRTFVCAQCHVEYYFQKPSKKLTFPWKNGLKADEILSYYEEISWSDFTHKMSGAPSIKAQHPEFEMYSQGIHARAGVACVDCHMPYEKSGSKKFTNHHVQSPVLNLAKACQTCHRSQESELQARIEQIQDRHLEMRDRTFDALVEFIKGIESNKEKINHESLTKIYSHQKRAQFLFDFVEAENSSGFHAPQESARILNMSLDEIRKGEKELILNSKLSP